MKVYVLTEMSHGEDPLSLDSQLAFETKEEAIKALKDGYDDVLDMLRGYEDVEANINTARGFYEVTLNDEDGMETIYYGIIKLVEVR